MRSTGTPAGLHHVATFCGQCSCGCPELYVDDAALPDRRIVITDDFGQRIQMSTEQLNALVYDVKAGVLDSLVTGPMTPPAGTPAWPTAGTLSPTGG